MEICPSALAALLGPLALLRTCAHAGACTEAGASVQELWLSALGMPPQRPPPRATAMRNAIDAYSHFCLAKAGGLQAAVSCGTAAWLSAHSWHFPPPALQPCCQCNCAHVQTSQKARLWVTGMGWPDALTYSPVHTEMHTRNAATARGLSKGRVREPSTGRSRDGPSESMGRAPSIQLCRSAAGRTLSKRECSDAD